MTLVVTHAKVTSGAVDNGVEVDLSDWNDDHALTGVTSPSQGGSGVVNNDASTITITGSFGVTFTISAATNLTLPTTGTLATTSNKLSAFAATTSAELAGVISDETGTGALVFATSPTLVTPALGTPSSGTVTNLTGTASISINGTVGATTPTTVAATTVAASTSLDTPVHKSAAAIDFQTNGTTYAGNITTGQQWYFGGTKQAPQTGPVLTVSKNTGALPAVGTPGGISGTAQSIAVLAGVDGSAADLHIMSFGINTSCGVRYLQAHGTAASRTATTGAGATIGANFAYSYTGSAYVATCGFIFSNTETTVSGSVSGGRIDLYATATGTTGGSLNASVGAGFMVGTTTDRGAGTINMTGGLFHGSFTVATLPSGVAAGNTAFASNARVFNGTGTQEGAAAGTGGLVTYNGTAWKLAGTNTTAIA